MERLKESQLIFKKEKENFKIMDNIKGDAKINKSVLDKLMLGGFIPAHPLALNQDLTINEDLQRRLTRYYLSCGVDGLAVGVHTTQFEIRDPEFNYFERVLEITADEINKSNSDSSFIRIAGVCGNTKQAINEAKLAKKYGYQFALLSMGGLDSYSEKDLIERTKAVANEIGIFGFYLQPSVGGRVLSYNFWSEFCEIDNVYAIKIAPFNRYHTLEVVRALCNSSRHNEIALYTGNDDNIVIDLITPYEFKIEGKIIKKRIVGGLLGHYSVWTKKSVELFNYIKDGLKNDTIDYNEILKISVEVTDMNSALFDVANNFVGSISGVHEVLRRQGLMEGVWCLNPNEKMSEGQSEELDRVSSQYDKWIDNEFVRDFLERDGSNISR